jgi:hypothetical protein
MTLFTIHIQLTPFNDPSKMWQFKT